MFPLTITAKTDVVVQWKGKQSLKSDGYPKLVQQEKKFLLQTSNKTGYIRMVFDDLDLSPGSFLQVGLSYIYLGYENNPKDSSAKSNHPQKLTRSDEL